MISLLIQLIGVPPRPQGTQPYLLFDPVQRVQGLLRTPIDWSPIIPGGLGLCPVRRAGAGSPRFLIFLRRDVAGG